MTEVEFRVLGVIEAHIAGKPVDLGPARQRAVLAVLLAEAARVVPMDQLIRRIWDVSPPEGARRILPSYISRLRGALSGASAEIHWRQGGYLIDIDPTTVDMHRYQRLVRQARTVTEDDQAVSCWQQAVALWRGAPFGDLDVPWLNQVAEQLTVQHHTALIDYRDLRLRRGEHNELIPELRATADTHPMDERVAAQLMLALYRSGRQADALAHYERLRRRLADELGSDPAPDTQRLYRQILTSDPQLAAPTRPGSIRDDRPEAPVTLPWATRDFTGRAAELDQLHAHTIAAGQPGTAAAVVISGGGGVGKTALAIHWGHQVGDRFPDGRLYINLLGFSEHPPLSATDAVRALLRQLGVPGAEIPSDPDRAQRLYRRTIDSHRMLLILDNAIDTGQVRPLLTGSPGLTLVTSRNQLTGLIVHEGAAQLSLGSLPDHDAQALAGRLLGGDHPVDSASRLSDVCAKLPLAIRLAATGYQTAHPDTHLDDYLEQLTGDRIGLLDAAADDSTAITGVLSRSVQRLPAALVRAFQLVGLHPGPRMDTPAIAALLELTERECRRVVRELAAASLLDETSPDRWSMHDLLAEYARESASLDTDAAYVRLLAHYTARLAAEPIDHQWINDERAALLACLQLPAKPDEFERYAQQLGERLFEVDLRADSRHVYEVLRQRCPPDSHIHAAATFGIGRAAMWQDEPDAEVPLEAALSRFQQLHDLRGEARARYALAEWKRGKGSHQEEAYLHVVELCRRAGDLDGESEAWVALALESTSRADFSAARERAARALQNARQTGSKRHQGEACRALGRVAIRTGDRAAAADHLTEAHDLLLEAGYQVGWAMCLLQLSDLDFDMGCYRHATDRLRQALAVFAKTGDRHTEAHTHLRMGRTALAMDEPAQARELIIRGLRLHQQLGDRSGAALGLMYLAEVLLATGAHGAAIEKYRQAATDLAELGFPRTEAEARLGLGRALTEAGDQSQAREQLELALERFERIDSPQASEARQALEQLPPPAPG